MTLELIFRIFFVAIFLAVFSISAYNRRRARKQMPQIARLEEGKFFLLLRMLVALPLYGAMIAYAIRPATMQWAALPLPSWLRGLGVVLGAATLPLLHWLFRSLGRNISETVLTKEKQELVVSGPYRWVRHPLYSVATASLFALSLVAANWFMGAMVLLMAALLPVLTEREERHLLEKFGERYREYMIRTGRFLPRLQLHRN
jgi:protein-S-isoprenylcysteine O-methyltransferase Ste14